jgi:hypothetical protein
MNSRVLPTRDEDDVPPCFGKLWEAQNPDCHRCVVFSSCGQKMRGAEVEVPSEPARQVAPLEGPVLPQVLHNLGKTLLRAPDASMPPESLLSIPEPSGPGDTPWTVLGRALVRGVGKSIGWTVTNFFDQVPLKGLFKGKK